MRTKMKPDKFQVLYLKLTNPHRKKNIHKEIIMQSPIVLVLLSDTEKINCPLFPAQFLSFYIVPSSFSISYPVPPK